LFSRVIHYTSPDKVLKDPLKMAAEAQVEQVSAEMDELSFDPTMKKKKSSARKKSVAFEDPSTAEIIPDAETQTGISSF